MGSWSNGSGLKGLGPGGLAQGAWPSGPGPGGLAQGAWPRGPGPESLAQKAWPREPDPGAQSRGSGLGVPGLGVRTVGQMYLWMDEYPLYSTGHFRAVEGPPKGPGLGNYPSQMWMKKNVAGIYLW